MRPVPPRAPQERDHQPLGTAEEREMADLIARDEAWEDELRRRERELDHTPIGEW